MTNKKAKKSKAKKSKANQILMVGVVLVIITFIAVGMSDVFNSPDQILESDQAIRYLGQPTNAEGLALAQAGKGDKPTLVFFHADW